MPQINVQNEVVKSCYKHGWSVELIAEKQGLTIAEVQAILDQPKD